MFLTEIKNVGKPNVEIDVKYSERDRTVRYGLLAISALSYTENQGGATIFLHFRILLTDDCTLLQKSLQKWKKIM
jgi:hypothetical protein